MTDRHPTQAPPNATRPLPPGRTPDTADPSRPDPNYERRLARLTKSAVRLALLTTPTTLAHTWLTLRPLRRTLAARRVQHHTIAAIEHHGFGTDTAVTTAITDTVTHTIAAVLGFADATAPATLTRCGTRPWTTSTHEQATTRTHNDRGRA